MTPQAIRAALARPDFWPELEVVARVGSVIDGLKARAEAGAPSGAALIALEQTAGRGRTGRHWASPRGGLWLGTLLRPPFPLAQAGCVSVLAAVAVARALRARYRLAVEVKWPNDLWVRGRKLCGVLVELSSCGEAISWMVVGLGLNVANPLPDGVRVTPTSLARELGTPPPLEHVAALVLNALAEGYEAFCAHGFGPVAEQWAALSALGEVVAFERGGRTVVASVVGLDEQGRLVVNTGLAQEPLAAEEVRRVGATTAA